MRIPVGGNIVEVSENTELITNKNCGAGEYTFLQLKGFYIKNEDVKEVYVKINGSDQMLLKQGEMFNLSGLTDVESCIVVTPSIVRWGGLR